MKKISIAILVLAVAFVSCKKTPEVNLKYVDIERDLVTVGTTTANIQCDYDYITTLKKAYFCYGEGENDDNFSSAEMRVVQNTLYVELIGLKSNTTYSYYYEFHNGFNSMRTVAKSFKTEISSISTTLPTVITADVTEITTTSAKGGGEVTNNGGAEVTEHGICWSTNVNPTISENHITAGSGMGTFTALMNGLSANTIYHVRAYATNEAGTAYGLDREFTTLSGGGSVDAPTGAINGLFTINENGDQVYFSQGNMQYQASTNTWRFAENQWNYVGGVTYYGMVGGNVYENGEKCDNAFISPYYNGWIDLFCWGTSGWDSGNEYYNPWDIHPNPFAPLFGPPAVSNLTGNYANSDWGVYNRIVNGGNQVGLWRTMTIEEWMYMLFTRNTISGMRFAIACVNNVNGVILLPDDWNPSQFVINNTNQASARYDSNQISLAQWSNLELFGVVFLPAAGGSVIYEGEEVVDVQGPGIIGDYWTVSCYDMELAHILDFSGSDEMPALNGNMCMRNGGVSVRLVHDAE